MFLTFRIFGVFRGQNDFCLEEMYIKFAVVYLLNTKE